MAKPQPQSQPNYNIDALSPGAQHAIVLCAGAFRFGGNWGFMRSSKSDFKEIMEALKTERPHIKAIPLSNGALITASENYLATEVNKAVPNAIDGSFVEMANKRRHIEKEKFQKFIKSVASGKSSHVQNKGKYQEVVIGIYSTNDTNLIRVGGKDYPAYKLSLVEALSFATQLESLGKKVYARAVKDDGSEVYDTAFNLASNSKGLQALHKGLELADSGTGVFLTLRLV